MCLKDIVNWNWKITPNLCAYMPYFASPVTIMLYPDNECSVRVSWWFTGISHKDITIAINVLYISFIMLTLCLKFLITHNAQNNAGIIGRSLHIFIAVCSTLTSKIPGVVTAMFMYIAITTPFQWYVVIKV